MPSHIHTKTKVRKELVPKRALKLSRIAQAIKRRAVRLERRDANRRLRFQVCKTDITSPIEFRKSGKRALKGIFRKRKVVPNDSLLTRTAA